MENRIRELRKAKKLTLKQLGEAIGAAESTVSHYETGRRQPDNETLLKLGELFGVTVEFLLGASKEKMPTLVSESEHLVNIVKIAGRDGSYVEKRLTDDQVKALRAIVDQFPDASDDL